MTGAPPTRQDESQTRTATIRTRHGRPELVRAALDPDNTDSMRMTVTWPDQSGGGADDTDGVETDTYPAPIDTTGSRDADHTDGNICREDGTLICEISRDTTSGLRSTADDYVVNLSVATRLVDRAIHHRSSTQSSTDEQNRETHYDESRTDTPRISESDQDESRMTETATEEDEKIEAETDTCTRDT